MAVYARPERRFRRAYVQPVRRRRLARRLPVFLHLGAVLAAAAGGAWSFDALRNARVLRIDTFTVEGNERLSRGEVVGLAEVLRGQNLLDADLDAARASLSASAWIRHAALRRVLPTAVHVTLVEREPIGLGRFGARLYFIDATGHVIDELGPRFNDIDLPIIDGLSAPGGAGGPAVDSRRASLAARLLADLEAADRDLAARVSQVDVGNPHDAVVLLNGDPVRIHVGDESFVARLRRYLEVVPALRKRVPDIDYVDVRFEQRVYVGPADDDAVARRAALRRSLAEPPPANPNGRQGLPPSPGGARIGLAAESDQRRQRGT